MNSKPGGLKFQITNTACHNSFPIFTFYDIHMLIISSQETNPCFNLAAEEYLLKNVPGDCFMLYRNRPSIIVGKHQNALSEINYRYVRENNIPVVRRLSGGGTVFHDPGNLNFSFVMNGEAGKLVDFRKFTRPILDVLQQLGIEARFEGRNNLTIGGLKFSGNAEHVYKNRVLHHGTLLYSATIGNLTEALKPGTARYTDRAVKSVPGRVTNISQHLREPMDLETFSDRIIDHVRYLHPESIFYEFNDEETEGIRELARDKYATWEWNFGYSPSYALQNDLRLNDKFFPFLLEVEKGFISKFSITEGPFTGAGKEKIEGALVGIPHEEKQVRARLSGLNVQELEHSKTLDEFITGLF